jgi:hypothetical protein
MFFSVFPRERLVGSVPTVVNGAGASTVLLTGEGLMNRRIRPLTMVLIASAVLMVARPALAGPPLICFPFDIGAAHSLPMGHAHWHDVDPAFDVSHLVEDTLAILTPAAPVNVRMETMRRATIYASKDPAIAKALLHAMQERATHPQPAAAALAVFDFGYLVETYREGQYAFKPNVLPSVDDVDGYSLVLKAHAMQNDAEMQRAATLIHEGLKETVKRGSR